MGRPVGQLMGCGWELHRKSCGRVRATGLGGTCTTLDSRRARATEMDFEPIDFAVVDHGAAHQRQDQLSPHIRDRAKLTEGNLRLFAAGSPPSAPPPRPAALALRLFSIRPQQCRQVSDRSPYVRSG